MPKVGELVRPAAALPAGGTTGQALGSADGSSLGWVTPAVLSAGPIVPVGYCLDNRLANVNAVSATVAGLALGITYYFPIWVWDAMSINIIAMMAATSNEANYMMGLLAADPVSGKPGTMLGYKQITNNNATAGFLTVQGAAPYTVPAGGTVSSLALTPGWYYVAFSHLSSSAGVNSVYGSAAGLQPVPAGMSNAAGSTPPATGALYGWQATGTITTGSPAVTAFTGAAGPLLYLNRSA